MHEQPSLMSPLPFLHPQIFWPQITTTVFSDATAATLGPIHSFPHPWQLVQAWSQRQIFHPHQTKLWSMYSRRNGVVSRRAQRLRGFRNKTASCSVRCVSTSLFLFCLNRGIEVSGAHSIQQVHSPLTQPIIIPHTFCLSAELRLLQPGQHAMICEYARNGHDLRWLHRVKRQT